MYGQFTCIHKASFILRALGQKEASQMIDSYRESSVALRKQFFHLDNAFEESKQIGPIAEFMEKYASKKTKLYDELNKCLDEVVECKKRIKAITS